jgi:GT2 family glycosyltransferase
VNVIIVDDKSPDDTLARMRERFGHHIILANEVNMGFAAACNVGLRAGCAEFAVLLNSDVEVEDCFAESVMAAFDAAGERTASVTPLLLAPDGTVDSFGITADCTGSGFVRFHGASMAVVSSDKPTLLGPYGAAAAYRRAALDEVGLLDENIFMYGEELDLAFRLRAAGWSAAAISQQLGVHIGAASAGHESARQRYLSGFGRGYLLRVYGILQSRHALRALAAEGIVILIRLMSRLDTDSLRGRWHGWAAGKAVSRRKLPPDGIDTRIGFVRSLRMRSSRYWVKSYPTGDTTS